MTTSTHLQGPSLVAYVFILLLITTLGAAARQLDSKTDQSKEYAEEGHHHRAVSEHSAAEIDSSSLTQTPRALKQWEHGERDQQSSWRQRDNRAGGRDERNRVHDEREQRDGPFTYRDNRDMRRAGYDRSRSQDESVYTRYDYGRDRPQDTQQYDATSQQYGARSAYDRMAQQDESAYRGYANDRDQRGGDWRRGYDVDQSSNRHDPYRQYNSRDQRDAGNRQQYNGDQAGRDERVWQQTAQRPYSDGERVQQYDSAHQHWPGHADNHHHYDYPRGSDAGHAHDSETPSQHPTTCGAPKLTKEERSKLYSLLDQADEWWDEFKDSIEAWLEEHGNVISEWWEENVSNDGDGDNGASGDGGEGAGQNQFHAKVKVYWHQVTLKGAKAGKENGEVKKADIEEQLKVLNTAFKPAGFKFVLESFKSHPMDKTKFFACEDSVTDTIHKAIRPDSAAATDLYMYTWKPCRVYGYAYPPTIHPDYAYLDGVVLKYTTLPNGVEPDANLGITAVHEVGHWLSLEHTFEGGCDDGVGDGVADTPPEAEATYGCPSEPVDTCKNQPGQDSIHNFMNYGSDICLDYFTKGQIKMMQKGWKLRVKLSM